MCYGYIYMITDTTNGMRYIGQHKYKNFMLDDSYHGSGRIIVNINKKRPETLKMEYMLGVDSVEEANFFENYFIEKLNTLKPNGYNLNTGGGVNIPSEETKEKSRIISKNAWANEEYRKSHSGENNANYKYIDKDVLYDYLVTQNKSIYEVCRILNTSFKLIKRRIESYNIPYNWFFEIDYETLYDLRINQKLSYSEIGKMYGVDKATVVLKCKKYNIYDLLPNMKKIIIPKEELYKEYIINNKTLDECSKIFGCDRSKIKKYNRKYNFFKRK